jgi:hypothetical protein
MVYPLSMGPMSSRIRRASGPSWLRMMRRRPLADRKAWKPVVGQQQHEIAPIARDKGGWQGKTAHDKEECG